MLSATGSPTVYPEEKAEDLLGPLQEKLCACIQCGTCTASCRNAHLMDFTPRRLWRLVLMGQTEEIFHSKTFALCSACYYCTLRCPRGLPLTDAMNLLKQLGAKKDVAGYRPNARFYGSFLDSVRRHGRINEVEFMRRYFILMKNPAIPIKFTPLGIRLLRKKKISMLPNKRKPEYPLDQFFQRVEKLENQQ
ncbi:MAG: 4Fe-4S dicluster domain-containing protein [Desulfobacterales bacterium]|nr:4Fe-4S dicluster domain-containing protein [Desulfobacterales bacterium]